MGESFTDKTYGANLISAFLGCVWLGITWTVGAVYFLRFRQDRRILQFTAGAMLLLASADSACIIAQEYDSLITHYGDVYFTLKAHWATGVIFGLIGASSLLLQTFFVYRITVVSQAGSKLWRVYAAVVQLLALTSTGLNWYVAVWVNRRESALDIVQLAGVVYASYACSIAGEFMSTIALVWFLILKPRRQNKSLNIGDNSLFVRLVRKTVETNMLTLIFHVSGIILIQEANAIGFWYSFPGQALTKIFAISLFTNLLSRSTNSFGSTKKGSSQGQGSEARASWLAERVASRGALGGDKRLSALKSADSKLGPDWEPKTVVDIPTERMDVELTDVAADEREKARVNEMV